MYSSSVFSTPEPRKFLNASGSSEQSMIAVVVPSVISALVILSIGSFLWFRRGARRVSNEFVTFFFYTIDLGFFVRITTARS